MHLLHNDPLVTKLQADKSILDRVLIDGGSSANVLFWEAFQKMGLVSSILTPSLTSLMAFDNSRVTQRVLPSY